MPNGEEIKIPKWLAPMLLGFFVVLVGGYIQSEAAEDTRNQIWNHAKSDHARMAEMEKIQQHHETEIELLKQDNKYIKLTLKSIANAVGALEPALPDND